MAFFPVPKHLHTRLLYANPCCALITANSAAAEGGHNAMCISWLTAIDNHGLFFLSINALRHSAANVLRERAFSLSVLSEAQRGDALACGGSHGTGVAGGKLAALGLPLAALGGGAWAGGAAGAAGAAPAAAAAALPVLAASPAHLQCCLVSQLAPSSEGGGGSSAPTLQGHLALLCRIEGAWVQEGYWAKHKLLSPTHPGLPRLLCFLGSGVFAAVQQLEGGGGGRGRGRQCSWRQGLAGRPGGSRGGCSGGCSGQGLGRACGRVCVCERVRASETWNTTYTTTSKDNLIHQRKYSFGSSHLSIDDRAPLGSAPRPHQLTACCQRAQYRFALLHPPLAQCRPLQHWGARPA
jgi:flavin reductase (DIM6/NTAB) family NADH-FMN oxidoreductase RutF